MYKGCREIWIKTKWLQGYRDAWVWENGETGIRGYMDIWILFETGVQGYRDIGQGIHEYMDIEIYMNTGIQDYRCRGIKEYRDIGLQGSAIREWQGLKDFRDTQLQRLSDTGLYGYITT